MSYRLRDSPGLLDLLSPEMPSSFVTCILNPTLLECSQLPVLSTKGPFRKRQGLQAILKDRQALTSGSKRSTEPEVDTSSNMILPELKAGGEGGPSTRTKTCV